ncbi:MAG: LicD family protein [Lachnospiraceae bacterium]|nr:LicD family protein [Lachnospiraceae bacterium]
MTHENSYFEDEIREGFFIPGMVKRCWALQMDILGQVDAVCKRHGIKWFADYGTLIGAARHHGFIPWDDDLDIAMIREDYDRFLEVAAAELPEGYRILNVFEEGEYENFVTRIVNDSQIDYSEKHLENNEGFPYVCGIDLFPLEHLYDDEEKEEERRRRAKSLIELAESVKGRKNVDRFKVIESIKQCCKTKIDHNLSTDQMLLLAITEVFRECVDADSMYLAAMFFWVRYKQQKFRASYFETVIRLPFEDGYMNVPAGYAENLELEYRDWYKVRRGGGAHDYPFYRDQEEILEAHLQGGLPYRYHFSAEDMEIKCEAASARTEIEEVLKLMAQTVDLILKLTEKNDVDNAVLLAERAQQLAIKAGEAIENIYGEGTQTVALLEEFCENIYELAEKLNVNKINPNDSMRITGLSVTILQSFTALKERNITVFFPFSAKHWKGMKDIYEQCKQDTHRYVIVVPIPYYDKTFSGKLLNERYDIDDYPPNIDCRDFRKIAFSHFDIDTAVIQNGYDEFNASVSVHPFFYARNIKKRAGKLIYIPFFSMAECDLSDEKTSVNLPYFAVIPGTVCADEIILENEQVRDKYIEALDAAAGLGFHNVWNEKVTIRTTESISDVSCNNRKCILFSISISDIFLHKDAAISKLKSVLELFKNESDTLEVLWQEDTCFFDSLDKIDHAISEKVKAIVNDFSSWESGNYIEQDNGTDTVRSVNAFYGSAGYLMNLSVRAGIPVMMMKM